MSEGRVQLVVFNGCQGQTHLAWEARSFAFTVQGPRSPQAQKGNLGSPPPPPAQLLITLFSAAFQGTTQPRWVQMELTPAACAATRSSVCVAFCEEACLHGSLLLPSDPDMTASGTVDAYHTSPDPSLPLLGTSGLPASGTGSVNATH